LYIAFDHEMLWLDLNASNESLDGTWSTSTVQLRTASEASISQAQRVVLSLQSRGGTDILAPVQQAIRVLCNVREAEQVRRAACGIDHIPA
jgi:hypothetical protein